MQSYMSLTDASSFCSKADNVSEMKFKAKKKKEVEKERQTKQKGKEKAEPHIPEIFVMQKLKKLTAEGPSPSLKL